jgi:hypothetical protein
VTSPRTKGVGHGWQDRSLRWHTLRFARGCVAAGAENTARRDLSPGARRKKPARDYARASRFRSAFALSSCLGKSRGRDDAACASPGSGRQVFWLATHPRGRLPGRQLRPVTRWPFVIAHSGGTAGDSHPSSLFSPADPLETSSTRSGGAPTDASIQIVSSLIARGAGRRQVRRKFSGKFVVCRDFLRFFLAGGSQRGYVAFTETVNRSPGRAGNADLRRPMTGEATVPLPFLIYGNRLARGNWIGKGFPKNDSDLETGYASRRSCKTQPRANEPEHENRRIGKWLKAP